jgi:hypothetical protein
MARLHSGKGRVATSTSNLANPETPIHVLAARFQNYMHLPDPTPLYVTLGALAGNMLTGRSLWLMLVGNSSSGKTAILESLLGVPKTRAVAALKNEAALLSGVKSKERAKDATGGILRELGACGCLVFVEFTSILTKPKDPLNELLAAFRQIYDGEWSRDIGGEGGRLLKYTGRVAILGGCTHAIDRNQQMNAEMGERMLYYRMPDTDGYAAAMLATNDTNTEGTKAARRELVTKMFAESGLLLESLRQRRALELFERDRIVNLAQLGARARSGVVRDWKTRAVTDVATPEVPVRMAQQLAQLYAGMEALGVEEGERWTALGSVVNGCMPLARAKALGVLEGMATKSGGRDSSNGRLGRLELTVAEVAERIPLSESATRNVLEDLELLGVLEKTGSKRTGFGYRVSGWALQRRVLSGSGGGGSNN